MSETPKHDDKVRADLQDTSENRSPAAERATEHDDGTIRRAGLRLHSRLGVLLFGLIMLQLNYLSFRHFDRWDLTSDARYTLSDRTIALLDELESPLEITLLFTDGETKFEDIRELLSRYESESDLVQVNHVDPDRNAAEARRIADQEDIQLTAAGDGHVLSEIAVVVRLGGESRKITREDLLMIADGSQVDVVAERAVSGAMLALMEGEETLVCATTGHGEWSLTGGERSLRVFRDQLSRENNDVRAIDTMGRIPEDCDALFVLGPQRAFAPEEAAAIVGYAEAGGRVLLALDPIPSRSAIAESGFEEPLALVGVLLDETIYLEPDANLRTSPDPTDQLIVLPQPHEVTTAALQRGGPFLTSLARTVRGEGEDVAVLFEGSALSFGESNVQELLQDADLVASEGDVPGPASIGVARTFDHAAEASEAGGPDARAHAGENDSDQTDHSEHADHSEHTDHADQAAADLDGRLLVVGDSDWLQDAPLSSGTLANLDVAQGTIGWLTGRQALLSIPARSGNLRAVVMSQEDVSSVWKRVFIFLPAAFLLLGAAVWWSRRE